MKPGPNLCWCWCWPRWRAQRAFVLAPLPLTLLPLLVGLAPGSLSAQPVSVQVEPASTNAPLGSAVTLCVAAQGDGPFLYQWQKNGLNLADQTNQCLVVTNLAIADGGSYRALVFNAAGALASEEGLLTVALNVLPGDDAFTNGTAISVASNSVQGVSAGATRELDEPVHFNLRTSNSVWYVWRAPASGIVTFDTIGSTFDTVLAVYLGSDFSRLTELASDDDGGGFHTSRVSWNAQAGVDYRVVIDGVTGETGTYVCNWKFEALGLPLPTITLHPQSQTVPEGGTAMFTAAGSDPRGLVLYQWFRNGTPIPGATSSNLTLVNVQTAHLGEYRVAVTNSVGRSVFSRPAVLEIGPDPGVQSKDKLAEVPDFDGGGGGRAPESLGGGSAGTFSLAAGTIINQRFFNGGTSDRCEPAHCGVPGGSSRWFQLNALSDGICTLDTLGSDVDTVLAVYLQNFSICTNLYEPFVDCNNDALGRCEEILVAGGLRERGSRLSFQANAGAVYRAVVDTVGGVRGTNLQFNVHFASLNSLPANTVPLGAARRLLLQLRGSSVTLRVATNFALPDNTYQWQLNGRAIAGAVRDRLVLPFLNYGDAGRYSVRIQNGTNRLVLPGAILSVLEPCAAGASNGAEASPGRFRLLGTTPEALLLEGNGSLAVTSSWQVVGPILPSAEPTLWDTGTAGTRFYRASRAAPESPVEAEP